MIPAAAAVTGLSATAPGWWQVRTLVQGTAVATVAMHCLRHSGDRLRVVLPPALTAGCEEDADGMSCRNGGRLTVFGTGRGDRFDIVARRTGRVAGQPRALALLHVEGRRIAGTCPTTTMMK